MEKSAEKLEIYKAEERETKDGKGNFFSGVLALSLSAIIVKLIGLIYKIPMLRLLGSEGMGYFNSAYEIYALLCVISTSGLPVAMSVLISRKRGLEERIFKVSMRLFLLLGAFGTAFMLAFSYPLARFLGSEKSFYCILAIAPTLLFICVSSAYRGYFQGQSRMAPTALSQIIEALGKLVLGIAFAYLALDAGYGGETVAAFAVLGLLLGTAVSAFCLMLLKSLKKDRCALPTHYDGHISSELLRIAVPITLSAAVVSLTKMIDMTMILRRLQSIGYDSADAFSVYGSYTTLCLPLFSLAPSLVSAVALPIVPKLSRAIADGNTEVQAETVNDGIRLTNLISMPVSAGLALYSKEILELLFRGEAEAVELCSPLLTLLAMSVSLSCLVTLGNAILQAYGHPTLPMVSMLAGAMLKMILAYIFIGMPKINIMGAPISTFFCDALINFIGFYFICRYAGGGINTRRVFFAPFAAAVLAVGGSKLIYGILAAEYGRGIELTLIAIAASAMLYPSFCLIFKAVELKEIKKIKAMDNRRKNKGKNKNELLDG